MNKLPVLLGSALCLLTLSACSGAANTPDYSVVDTAPADLSARVSIRSLEQWNYFNADGSYTENCLHFLQSLIYGTSEFPELAAVRFGEYELIRDPHEYEPYELLFRFSVVESDLAALPVGTYSAVLADVTDCYLTYLEAPALPAAPPDFSEHVAAKAVTDWIECDYSWDTPGYGNFTADKHTVQKLINYYMYRDGEISRSDFLAAANADFGAAWTIADLAEVIPGDKLSARAVNSRAAYDILDICKVNDGYTVDVQFYADCNRWISSSRIVYTVSESGHVIGCTVTEKSPYTPYGLHPTFE